LLLTGHAGRVFSLVAILRSSTSSQELRDLATRLREHEHVGFGPGQLLVTIPAVGTVIMTESRTLIEIDLVVENEDAAARACAALVRAIGSAPVALTWLRDETFSARLP
jgi:hypothetical protein